jgi:hypothetical protein
MAVLEIVDLHQPCPMKHEPASERKLMKSARILVPATLVLGIVALLVYLFVFGLR